MKLTPIQAKKILAKRRAKTKSLAQRFNLDNFLFKQQLEFVRDPARYSTALCSVRAGKTTACAADLIDTAIRMPGTIGLYITLSRSNAKRIIWQDLLRICRKFKIEKKTNENDLSIKFPNGSTIYVSGANTEKEIENFRGLSKVALVYIDEAQAFRFYLKDLINDIIVKRLYDLNGRCRLIGTPGPISAGYFFEATKAKDWSHHHWTIHDNVFIEESSGLTAAQHIAQDCARQGVDINHPSIQRECFGRWADDPESLLLAYDPPKNHFETLPNGTYSYILGIDLGFEDCDSLSVLAWTEQSPVTFLVEEIVTSKQDIDELMKQIADVSKRFALSKIVADTGGLGKKIVETLKARYSFPIEAADKTRKMENYALLNNALRTRNFLAKKDSRFAQDCNLLEKDKDKSTPDKIVVKGHSDAVDSVLYAFRYSPAYAYVPPIEKLKPGSVEWAIEQQELMRQRAFQDAMDEQEQLQEATKFFESFEESVDLKRWKK